ncbi:MAG: fluoride efflux transporter CrcB [Clostridia bacterium]|nr:fluoride efflux transporter CrcB [Clostridia bacterium]
MQKLLFVGLGGFIGAALRYFISIKMAVTPIPWGTLLVNVIGGLLIGVIMQLSLTTNSISPNMKLFLTTGVMGGLTTFSSFSYETVTLFSAGDIKHGILNICLNLFLCLGGVLLGQYATLKLV